MKTFALLLLALLPLAASAQGQKSVAERLEKTPRHLEWITVKHGNREVKCFIGFPEVKDKAMAVVVIHEIFGLSDWVRNIVDQLAERGYIAIAPDFLSGVGPNGGGTAALGGADGARGAIGGLPPSQVTADISAAVDYVRALPACNGKVVVAGFCWGGQQTFRYATENPKIAAGFVFYGNPANTPDMPKITAPIYGFYGGNDNRINATIPAATEAMKAAGKVYEPVIYEGAGHGFMRAGQDDNPTPANKKGMDEAWVRWTELLANTNAAPAAATAPAATPPAGSAAPAASTPPAPAASSTPARRGN